MQYCLSQVQVNFNLSAFVQNIIHNGHTDSAGGIFGKSNGDMDV
jgi:hypothetical protein